MWIRPLKLRQYCQLSTQGANRYKSATNVQASLGNVGKSLTCKRSEKIAAVLKDINAYGDGLPPVVRHMQGLVKRSEQMKLPDHEFLETISMADLDMADKTNAILSSRHPVKYILEREIYKMAQDVTQSMGYHYWVSFFGRCFQQSIYSKKEFEKFLFYLSCNAESGMLSSEVHETVVNTKDECNMSECNMGNKFAVLVGDYFAIRAIYMSEKLKNNATMMHINTGVEDFTCSHFKSDYIRVDSPYPFVLSPNATLRDWVSFNVSNSGYFTGSLKATLELIHPNYEKNLKITQHLKTFQKNLTACIKAVDQIEELEKNSPTISVSPFTFLSLPALLYEKQHTGAFNGLRNAGDSDSNNPLDFFENQLSHTFLELRDKIKSSDAIHEAKRLATEFGQIASQTIEQIGTEPTYVNFYQQILNAMTDFEQ